MATAANSHLEQPERSGDSGLQARENTGSAELSSQERSSVEILNIINASMECWQEFAAAGLSSPLYIEAKAEIDAGQAASIALFRTYVDIMNFNEKQKLLEDGEYFFKYASGCLKELTPEEVHRRSRLRNAFMSKIRALLKAEKHKDPERYMYIRTVLRMCSSVDHLLAAWDKYREFMFRIYPQHHHPN